MIRRRRFCFALMMLCLVTPAMAASHASSVVPASCPVTLPPEPAFIPTGRYPSTPPGAPHSFWHGTSGLWTRLDSTGMHSGGPVASTQWPGVTLIRNKSFWWSPGFHPMGTPEPKLKIEGRRLDDEAPALPQPWVTNAHVPEYGGWTMLTMLELPIGCWEVTGSYGADSVTFVVWVTPPKPLR
jgi:hypothetical protein